MRHYDPMALYNQKNISVRTPLEVVCANIPQESGSCKMYIDMLKHT